MRIQTLILFLIVLSVIAFGTLGFRYAEKMSLFDAFYLTIITLTTVGYGDVIAHSYAGKTVSMIVAVLGIGTFISAIPLIVLPMFESAVRGVIEIPKKLKNHVIICGYTDLSEHVVKKLQQTRVPFIVVEPDQEKVNELRDKRVVALKGDPSEEGILDTAGIKYAKSLLVTMVDDAECALVTMTARSMRKDLRIIAEATFERNVEKLRRAGADAVFSPEVLVGEVLAEEAMKQ